MSWINSEQTFLVSGVSINVFPTQKPQVAQPITQVHSDNSRMFKRQLHCLHFNSKSLSLALRFNCLTKCFFQLVILDVMLPACLFVLNLRIKCQTSTQKHVFCKYLVCNVDVNMRYFKANLH